MCSLRWCRSRCLWRRRTTGLPARTLTAFVVAGSAFLLRVGGRAALVSAVDLNFATENPALKNGLEAFLGYARTVGTGAQRALSVLACSNITIE